MKKALVYLVIVFVGVVMSSSSCKKNEENDARMLAMLKISKMWQVHAASFGTENADADMYANYMLELMADGSYKIMNPDAVPSPNMTMNNEGTWEFDTERNTIIFDNDTPQEGMVYVVFTSIDGTAMNWEWDVKLEGKTRTTYRFEMESAE